MKKLTSLLIYLFLGIGLPLGLNPALVFPYKFKKNAITIFLVCMSIFTGNILSGQGGLFSRYDMFDYEGGITYIGPTFGMTHTDVLGIEGTLGASISDPSTYTFKTSYLKSYNLGITAMYGVEGTDLFFLFEGEYSTPFLPEDPFERAQGLYSDIEDLEYSINFAYQKLHLRLMAGAYLFSWFSFQAGFDWGINTTPNYITYNSNDKTIGRDLAVRDGLIDKLEGKNDFGPLIGASINIPFERVLNSDEYYKWFFYISALRKFGFSDTIYTYSNNYRLQERQNRTQSWIFSAGFRISI